MFLPTLSLKAWLTLGGGILCLLIGTGIGWKLADTRYQLYHAKVNAEKVAQQTALLRAIEEANARTVAAESAYQEAIARLRTRVRTITKEVVREVEKPVYRECVVPDTGRVLLNDAVREANTAIKSSGEMP